ncbi:MAG: hypothetical protein E7256_02450 [Lachnospiraceae bacterium]|nr:hypothetical protein [Lachnospiraceae bacterium]
MGEGNVLSGGIDVLYAMKDSLEELEKYKGISAELAQKEDALEKEIASREKALQAESDAVVKKRRQEIEASYEEQISKTKARIKKVKAKKEKRKNAKVSERIKMETGELQEERRGLEEELKLIFRNSRIPNLFNNRLYYALFMPRTFKDFLIILGSMLLVLLAIPVGVYRFLLPQKTWYLVLSYVVTVVIFGGIYLFIASFTKEKNQEAAGKVKEVRKKLALNHKKIKAEIKSIRKDKDESIYGLEKFDDELKELEEEIEKITNEKKKALVSFESNTKNAVIEEIQRRDQKERDALRDEHDAVYRQQKQAEEKAKACSIDIANRYEAYLGKSMMSTVSVDRLIEIMKQGECTTVAEALAALKTLPQQNS